MPKKAKCDCSKDGKGLGYRNGSGHKEDCPVHVEFNRQQKEKADQMSNPNALRGN